MASCSQTRDPADSPFPLLPAALRVDKDQERVSVWHGADLLKDKHVGIILRVALIYLTNDKSVQF